MQVCVCERERERESEREWRYFSVCTRACTSVHVVILVNMKLTGEEQFILMYEQGPLGSVVMLAFRRPARKV
jgi:hypothetical protein